jgi:hypothetical protein
LPPIISAGNDCKLGIYLLSFARKPHGLPRGGFTQIDKLDILYFFPVSEFIFPELTCQNPPLSEAGALYCAFCP